MKKFSDHLGIIMSCVCLIHCLALPTLLLLINITEGPEWFHALMLMATVVVSGHALWHGFKTHCRHIVLVLGGLGVFTMTAALVGPHESETMWTTIGAVFIVVAHLYNMHERNKCCDHDANSHYDNSIINSEV